MCLEESRKQIRSEKRCSFTDSRGEFHVDYEYKREGVAKIYMRSASRWAATARC
jgi:hypothetical protein